MIDKSMDLLLIIFIAFFVAILFSMLDWRSDHIYTTFFLAWPSSPCRHSDGANAYMITTAQLPSISKTAPCGYKIAYPVIVNVGHWGASWCISFSHSGYKNDPFLLSIVLFLASIRISFRNMAVAPGGSRQEERNKHSSGFFIGIISSLAGIGGGTFFVPVFIFFRIWDKKKSDSNILIRYHFYGIIRLSGASEFSRWTIDMKLLLFAGIAAFIGPGRIKIHIQKAIFRSVELLFALVLLGVAVKLWYGS